MRQHTLSSELPARLDAAETIYNRPSRDRARRRRRLPAMDVPARGVPPTAATCSAPREGL